MPRMHRPKQRVDPADAAKMLTVISIAERQLSKLLETAFAGSDRFEEELTVLLQKYNFKQSYIEEVVPDLVEAYLNEDEKPVWLKEDAT